MGKEVLYLQCMYLCGPIVRFQKENSKYFWCFEKIFYLCSPKNFNKEVF